MNISPMQKEKKKMETLQIKLNRWVSYPYSYDDVATIIALVFPLQTFINARPYLYLFCKNT